MRSEQVLFCMFADGVTVVLYKVMQTFNLMDDITADQIVLGIVKFFVVCFGGLLIGMSAGVVSALLTRKTVNVGGNVCFLAWPTDCAWLSLNLLCCLSLCLFACPSVFG